ncbi:MAG TPA: hypothetical protein VGN52_07165 [Burkholderiales bacterium]|jgi:hypothetical protein
MAVPSAALLRHVSTATSYIPLFKRGLRNVWPQGIARLSACTGENLVRAADEKWKKKRRG